ncbi:MAG: hypothetical protein WC608_03085 [Parcubacteria group bacterium]
MSAKIVINFGKPTANANGELETVLNAECSDNGKPIKNEGLELFISRKSTEKKKTDASGKASFILKCPQGTTVLEGEIKILPNKGWANWTLNLPAASTSTAPPTQTTAPAQPTVNKTDPVEIQVLRSALPKAGEFRLIARVLNYKGDGLKNRTVGFLFRGKLEELETNSGGVCQFPKMATRSISIKPGAEEKITAFVSGISQLTTTTLCRRRRLTGKSKADAQKNNQRARKFFAAAGIGFGIWLVIAIAISSLAGWGEPLLSSSHALTSQENFYNTIPGVAGLGKTIEVDSGLGHWQKTVIFLPLAIILLWTVFSFFYGIISLREEVAEAWRASMESIVDRNYVKAHDPLFERIAAWSGHLSRARTHFTGPLTTEPIKKSPVFWDYFRSDILSELVMDAIPKIFRAITGRK